MPGLYFIGEVVDVTGQLGGFNFQWAWASGFALGRRYEDSGNWRLVICDLETGSLSPQITDHKS